MNEVTKKYLTIAGFIIGAAIIIGSYILTYNYGWNRAAKDIIPQGTKIEYVDYSQKGNTVKDTLHNIPPVIIYNDTGSIKYIPNEVLVKEKIDSAKILEDYSLTRDYSNILFDNDSLGKLTINSTVNYNRLKNMDYEFSPMTHVIEKTVTNTVEIRRCIPFIGVGVMTNNFANAQIGLFFKGRLGISGTILYDLKSNQVSYGGSLLYKLR